MPHVKQEPMDTTDDAGNTNESSVEHILSDLRAFQSPNSASTSMPQPQSEWDILLTSLRATPIDPEGWNRLVRLAEDSSDIARIKEAYDGLLLIYPNTVSAQIAYVNHFINPGQYRFAEELFKRFLLSSPHIELWRVYLSYVRRTNSSPQALENVRKAFEFALSHIGHDKDAGDIWVDYIRFIQQSKPTTTHNERTKLDELRRIYQRAVHIPLENVEQLWQEYEHFENGLNHVLAKKFIKEHSPANRQAHSILRLLHKHVGAIFPKNPLPSLPICLPKRPEFDAADRVLVGAWKGYLRWEESNPLELEDKDRAVLLARIRGVYRKALVRMRFFSEIWHMAYIWTATTSTPAQALKVLKDGIAANPASFVLNFAYAETLESDGEDSFVTVHEVYTTFLAALRTDLEQRKETLADTSGELNAGQDTSGVPDPSQVSLQLSNACNAYTADEINPLRKDFNERRREYGVVWIMYMRFARRAEGTKAGRDVFAKARVDNLAPWQVYEAAAQWEYHSMRDPSTATRIYQKGLEIFRNDADYVVQYLSFLLAINDERNAGALFSEVSKTFPPNQARPIWECWARHQYQHGDLTTALAIEKNMAEINPNDYPIKRFAQRHIFNGIDAIASRDLGFAYARLQSQASNKHHTGSQFVTRTHSQRHPGRLGHSDSTDRSPRSNASAQREGGYSRRDRDHPEYRRERGASPARRDQSSNFNSPHSNVSAPSGSGRNDINGKRSRIRDTKRNQPSRASPPHNQDIYAKEGVQIPSELSRFMSALPPASSFTGPVLPPTDLIQTLRNAVLPSATDPRHGHLSAPMMHGQAYSGYLEYDPYDSLDGGSHHTSY